MNEMRKQQFTEAHTWVRAELDRCVNFWLKNGMDPEFGGVYTCLDRTGKIYSTDKSVWMQGRCGWIFAHLCTVYGTKPEWLDASRSCLDFMERHCFNHAAGDRMYFTVTKDGQPLRQRRYCFSEAFCAMANPEKRIYAVQFHPEVTHSEEGQKVIANFLYNVCGCTGDWTMSTFIDNAIASIREQVGPNGRVMLGLSGGVDSSVAAALISRAIGERLTCVYVDHGFMRKNETESVREVFTKQFPVNLVIVDARDRFLTKLAGVSDPETKRKLIGGEFVYCFADEAKKLEGVEFLAQGTIYPDVIESGSVKGSAVIKSHHNVGGLPADVRAKFTGGLVEPLRMLFKDEVRKVGEELSMPHDMVWRQPFPGPGLAIRIMGDITAEKLETVRESDAILREEVALAGLERDVNQYFTVLTNTRTVGVMGDERTHDFVLAIRAVTTDDFMTVDWARLPYDLLAKVSARIVNEVPRVNRVVYDITTKPPATVEWE